MAGRDVNPTPANDFRAFVEADRIAHAGWDPYEVDTRPSAVFREFGRARWLVVPLAALALALLVWVVGMFVGVNGPVVP